MAKYKFIEKIDGELPEDVIKQVNEGGYGEDMEFDKGTDYYDMVAGDLVKWNYDNAWMELEVNLIIQFSTYSFVRMKFVKAGLNNG